MKSNLPNKDKKLFKNVNTNLYGGLKSNTQQSKTQQSKTQQINTQQINTQQTNMLNNKHEQKLAKLNKLNKFKENYNNQFKNIKAMEKKMKFTEDNILYTMYSNELF